MNCLINTFTIKSGDYYGLAFIYHILYSAQGVSAVLSYVLVGPQFKETIHRYSKGAPRNRLPLSVDFNRGFPIPVTTMLDLMLSQLGPKWSTSSCTSAIGPIRDTKYRILELEMDTWTPYVKSENSPFNVSVVSQ